MQLTIDRVSDVKRGQYGWSSKIHVGDDAFYANEDATQYAGKTVDAELTEKKSAKGNVYKIAKILGLAKEQPAYANGATQPWSEWEAMAARAHALAKVLEPDTICPAMAIPQGEAATWKEAAHHVDRSRARMAFVATVLIAFSNGKIADDIEEGVPF